MIPGLGSSGIASAAPSHAAHYVPLVGHAEFSDGIDAAYATVYILPYGVTDTDLAYEIDYTDGYGNYATNKVYRTNARYTVEVDATDYYGNDYTHYLNFSIPGWARGTQQVPTLTFDTTYY
jgi:hypothetical protein